MKPRDRQNRIVDLVDQQGEVTVEELTALFDVSAETIRRDLAQLAASGALLKAHGVARRMRHVVEGSFDERLGEHAEAKAIIAQKVAAEIRAGEALFIDTGTTTLACASVLSRLPNLTVVTNSVAIARLMATGEGQAEVHLLGGRYAPDNAQTVGVAAAAGLEGFQADVAVLTVTALDAEGGAMDANPEEAHIARTMLANARRSIILAHGAKLGRTAPHRVCRLDQIDMLVCDRHPDAPLAKALAAAGVELR